tara:strand:- start:908 stop:1090 length:183 start_codon:yes stop_codon:yes gene_type:complete
MLTAHCDILNYLEEQGVKTVYTQAVTNEALKLNKMFGFANFEKSTDINTGEQSWIGYITL